MAEFPFFLYGEWKVLYLLNLVDFADFFLGELLAVLVRWLLWIACRKAFLRFPPLLTLWVTAVRYPSSRLWDINSKSSCILSSTMGSLPPRLMSRWSETACVNVKTATADNIFDVPIQLFKNCEVPRNCFEAVIPIKYLWSCRRSSLDSVFSRRLFDVFRTNGWSSVEYCYILEGFSLENTLIIHNFIRQRVILND